MELDEQIDWLVGHLEDAASQLSQSPIPETAEYWQRVLRRIPEVTES